MCLKAYVPEKTVFRKDPDQFERLAKAIPISFLLSGIAGIHSETADSSTCTFRCICSLGMENPCYRWCISA